MTDHASAAHALFDHDEIREVLETSFYRSEPENARPDRAEPKKRARPAQTPKKGRTPAKARKPKPDHYEVLCISMYVEDLRSLDDKVSELKQRGHRRMTRSALIRFALDRLAIEDVPRPVI